MKASVLVGHGGLDQIVYREVPDPVPGPDDVVVRVRATSVNFHDIFSRRGMPGIKTPLPLITGSDVAGEVFELGDRVDGWARGDRVLVDPAWASGQRFEMVGETCDGGRAELMRVPASQLLGMPDKLSFEIAAALPLAYGTAYRMMITRGRVTESDRVLILGASGGVGTGCVLLAKLVGAEVAACASSDAMLARLAELGADHLINYKNRSFRNEVSRLWGRPHKAGGDGGADVVVNFTGGDTWVPSLQCLSHGGRLLTCGATAGFGPPTDIRYIWTFEHNILGCNGWKVEDLVELMRLATEQQLVPVIDRVMSLSEAAEAERLVEEREAFGKIVLTP